MNYIFLVILIGAHLTILFNIQFTAWPEMFSYPYLVNNGFKLYQDIGLPYQPILPLFLAFIYKIFGYNLLILELFTWTVILINDFLIFFISRRVIGKGILVFLPLSIYIFLQPFTDGNMLWFDLATTPLILFAVVFLYRFKDWRSFFWFGFFLALAFFIKQQTGIIYLFLLLFLTFKKKWSEILYIILGSLVPASLVFFYVLVNGILKDYIFWTIIVPIFYYPKFPGYTTLPNIKEVVVTILLFFPAILILPKVILKNDLNLKIIFVLFLGAFLAAFPRFAFFRFQPAIVLCVFLFVYLLSENSKKLKILVTSSLTFAILLVLRANLELVNLPARFYGEDEIFTFNEMKRFTSGSKSIFMLNEHSLYYVMGGYLPPKPWIDNYIWYMEIDGMQDKIIKGFSKDKPEFIFRKPSQSGNWYSLGTYEPRKIVSFVEKNYEKIDNIGSIEVWRRN